MSNVLVPPAEHMKTNNQTPDFELKDLVLEGDTASLSADDLAALVEMEIPPLTFDYSGVSSRMANEAEAAAERIRNNICTSIIAVGNDLITVKGMLPGKFGEWIKHHFGMSQSTAENYMNAARHFANTPRVIEALPQRVVYNLAAKGTPDQVRKEIIAEITAGTVPAREEVEQRILEGRNEERAKRKEERTQRQEERQRKQEEREWKVSEKMLRKAGRTNAEVDAERERWEAEKAQKKRAEDEERQKAAEAEKARQAEERDRGTKAAHEAVAFLRKHLGAEFGKFQAIMKEADCYTFGKTIEDMPANPAV